MAVQHRGQRGVPVFLYFFSCYNRYILGDVPGLAAVPGAALSGAGKIIAGDVHVRFLPTADLGDSTEELGGSVDASGYAVYAGLASRVAVM